MPRPLQIAILNDYEVVIQGLARMLEPYSDRVQVVELTADKPSVERVDVALYDTFSQTSGVERDVTEVVDSANAHKVVVYSWNLFPQLIDSALRQGASGYLTKRLTAADLVEALERVSLGEVVVSKEDIEPTDSGDWPGRHQGLTTRESEIIALITQGLSNQQIADRAFLSINSVKSYIRSSYRKMGVTSRSRAVLWGIEHGFRPDHLRIRPLEDDL